MSDKQVRRRANDTGEENRRDHQPGRCEEHNDPATGRCNQSKTEADARGQFARSRAGRLNDGIVSADPRVISRKPDGDATFPIPDRGKDDK